MEQILTHLLSGSCVTLISGRTQTVFSLAEAVANGFIREKRPRVIALEQSLIDHTLRFGGTFDGVLEIDGEFWVVDWKSSNQLADDFKEQVAAYIHLWGLQHPEMKIAGGIIVRVDKKAATPYLEVVYYRGAQAYFPSFKRKLDAWWAANAPKEEPTTWEYSN